MTAALTGGTEGATVTQAFADITGGSSGRGTAGGVGGRCASRQGRAEVGLAVPVQVRLVPSPGACLQLSTVGVPRDRAGWIGNRVFRPRIRFEGGRLPVGVLADHPRCPIRAG